MIHTNTPIQHNIHTAYTSLQKNNFLADFYKQLSTPAILLQEQHNTITKQINQLSSAHNTDIILTDTITTSDIQEAIQNHKDSTLGSIGIKNHTYNVTHLPQSILSTLSLIYNYILKTAQFPSYYLVKYYI